MRRPTLVRQCEIVQLMLQDATNPTIGECEGHGCSRAPPQTDVVDPTAAQHNETVRIATAGGLRAARRQWDAAAEGRFDATDRTAPSRDACDA